MPWHTEMYEKAKQHQFVTNAMAYGDVRKAKRHQFVKPEMFRMVSTVIQTPIILESTPPLLKIRLNLYQCPNMVRESGWRSGHQCLPPLWPALMLDTSALQFLYGDQKTFQHRVDWTMYYNCRLLPSMYVWNITLQWLGAKISNLLMDCKHGVSRLGCLCWCINWSNQHLHGNKDTIKLNLFVTFNRLISLQFLIANARSFIKMLNSSGPSRDPWGTPADIPSRWRRSDPSSLAGIGMANNFKWITRCHSFKVICHLDISELAFLF